MELGSLRLTMALKDLRWILFILLKLLQECSSQSQYAPAHVTWEVKSATTSRPAARVTNRTTPFTWWPDLTVDLCDLARGSWDLGDWTTQDGRPECANPASTVQVCRGTPKGAYNIENYGCGHATGRYDLYHTPFYVCPGFNRTASQIRSCGGVTDFFCASWGCEQTGTVHWRLNPTPTSPIKITRVPQGSSRGNPCNDNFTCNNLRISFTNAGKQRKDWGVGLMWGIRMYQSGYDKGLLFTITQKVDYSNPEVGPVVGPTMPKVVPLQPQAQPNITIKPPSTATTKEPNEPNIS